VRAGLFSPCRSSFPLKRYHYYAKHVSVLWCAHECINNVSRFLVTCESEKKCRFCLSICKKTPENENFLLLRSRNETNLRFFFSCTWDMSSSSFHLYWSRFDWNFTPFTNISPCNLLPFYFNARSRNDNPTNFIGEWRCHYCHY
jgi:hypothetical protein